MQADEQVGMMFVSKKHAVGQGEIIVVCARHIHIPSVTIQQCFYPTGQFVREFILRRRSSTLIVPLFMPP